ncbi:hypothetical protein EBB07_29060 [Paenibacillaceae bacterium]|nr:hypothetical protein EBB07_29060 [Paenibacillaceae bacterium]
MNFHHYTDLFSPSRNSKKTSHRVVCKNGMWIVKYNKYITMNKDKSVSLQMMIDIIEGKSSSTQEQKQNWLNRLLRWVTSKID